MEGQVPMPDAGAVSGVPAGGRESVGVGLPIDLSILRSALPIPFPLDFFHPPFYILTVPQAI